jgi:hypothetical protein
MRILFKIIAAPFVVILSILWAVLAFVFGALEGLLQYVCGFGVLLSIAFFIGGFTPSGIFCLVFSFLISPVGLPLIADFLIDCVAGLNNALKNFIMA